MDLSRNDWPSTMIGPDSNGRFDFVFIATTPHSTDYFKFYVTEDGYDPLEPLKWSDLEDSPFCTINEVTLADGRNTMNCPLPQGKSGKHVIYTIWQRDDSTEAFIAVLTLSSQAEYRLSGNPLARSVLRKIFQLETLLLLDFLTQLEVMLKL